MNQDLMNKILREESLRPDEALQIDQALEGGQADQTRSLVSGLPSDDPSLAWRSELNQKLRRQMKAKRARIWLFGAAAVATPAAAFALFMIFSTPDQAAPADLDQQMLTQSSQPAGSSIESELISTHFDLNAQLNLGVDVPYDDGTGVYDWSSIDGL